MNSNRWILLIAIAILAVGGFVGYQFFFNQTAAEPDTGDNRTVVTFVGDLSATASASGQLLAQREADLALEVSGEVSAVPIAVGDYVEAGDLLVTLDATAFERTVLDAEQTLIIQQANLEQLLESASAAEIAAAEASLAQAQAQLDDLLNGPSAEEIAASQATITARQASVSAAAARVSSAAEGGTPDQILAAQQALDDAEVAYTTAEEAHRATYDCEWNDATGAFDCVGGSDDEVEARGPAQQAYADLLAAQERLEDLTPGGNTTSISNAQASLAAAQANLDAAEARHAALLADPTAAEIASAEASVASAEAQLDNVLSGPTAEAIAKQEIQVEQAAINLEKARLNLANTTLTAPFAGIVTAIEVTEGETASGAVISMIDLDSLEVELDVDEVDLSSLAIGQDATITLESWPDTEIDARVVAIAPENTPNSAGTVTYQVNLELGDTDLPVLNGMTADAQLVTANREGVLLLANEAIKVDRSTDTYSVDLVNGRSDDGTLQVAEVEITIGLRDGDYTQVIGGLDSGDEVAVNYNPPPLARFGPGQN